MRFTGVLSVALVLAGLASAQDPRYSNKLAPYVVAPSKVVDLMLDLAAVKPGETVYDLGSGDGRILIAAAERKANAVGIEINPKLVATANDEINRAGLADLAKVVQGDVMQIDISSANVVTIYMDSSSNAKLRPQLEKYLKPGARVVSYDAEIPGWKPVRVERTDERRSHTVYLYEIRTTSKPQK